MHAFKSQKQNFELDPSFSKGLLVVLDLMSESESFESEINILTTRETLFIYCQHVYIFV